MFAFKNACKNLFQPRMAPNHFRFSTTVKTLKDDIFTVSLIGRPNVGKSSLFNRLAGGKYAMTDSLPGLTRDRKEIISNVLEVPIRLVDTAGWEVTKGVQDAELKKKMMEQTAHALIYSDLALFMIDIRAGIANEDMMLAHWLRKKQIDQMNVKNFVHEKMKTLEDIKIKKILLVGNKAENDYETDIYSEVYKLGFGDPILISAEHGDGMHELLAAISKEIPPEKKEEYEQRKIKRVEKHLFLRDKFKQELIDVKNESENPEEIDIDEWEREFDAFNKDPEENSDLDSDNEIPAEETMTTSFVNTNSGIQTENILKKRPIQISLVGRPNVGKSTFVNGLLKENRVIANDLPGTTRDAISVQWIYKNRKINLIDTAGLNKSVKLKTKVEQMMQDETMNAIKYSHVVVCLIDALDAFRVQDMSVAQYILKEGRGLVLAVNKWDLVTNEWRSKASKFMYKQAERSLGTVKDIPLHFVSALTNYKLEKVMDEVLRTYDKWNIRISTGLLNDWLNRFKKRQNMPSENGQVLKIRFMTQIKSRPPTFSIFVNDKNLFNEEYLRFMRSNLSQEFELHGIPIRFYIRDVGYKKIKKNVEKIEKTDKMKYMFLRKRRLATLAKVKLQNLSKSRPTRGSSSK